VVIEPPASLAQTERNAKVHPAMKNLLLLVAVTSLITACAGGNIRDKFPNYYWSDLEGKYGQVIAEIEPAEKRNPNLDLTRRFLLCRAYGMTHAYSALFPCLDKLQALKDSGAKEDDVLMGYTVIPAVIRAEALIELGQYQDALDQAKAALKYAKEYGDYDRYVKYAAEDTLYTLGIAYIYTGNRQKAEEYIAELSARFRFGYAVEYRDFLLAKLNFALGNYKEAARLASSDSAWAAFHKSFYMSDGILKDGTDWFAFHKLSRGFMHFKALFEYGNLAEAKQGYEKILGLPQTKDYAEIYWPVLNDLGQIALREGKNGAAIDHFKRAIEVIEQQRSNINTEAFKIGFVGNKQAVYRSLVAVLVTENRPGEAFEYAERGKARALVDMLASKEKLAAKGNDSAAKITTLLSETKKETEAAIAASYQGSAKSGARALNGGSSSREKLAGIDQETASLISVTVPDVKEIQSLLPAGETLIEYFGSGKDLFAFVVDKQTVQAVRLDGEGLSNDVLEFRNWISPGSGETRGNRNLKRQQGVAATAPASAGALYERLFKPLEAHIRNKNLTIVPHDALHYLPFAALNSGKDYLLDRYSIRMLPSASVMKYMGRSKANKKTTTALVLGNPDLGDPTLDLPYAGQEATAVGGMIKGSKVFLRKQATKAEVRKYGGSAQYIHFASHGIFKPEQPLESGLALAPEGDGNGMLTVGELYEMRLDADLITLSACETALGKIEKGDDVVGITRGFLYAGANSIVSTLWQVDDEATGMLMQNFYKQLKTTDKRTALRNAQLALRNGAKSQPYYWAAFQITGGAAEDPCADGKSCGKPSSAQGQRKRAVKKL
jgi:CHAT domain-containing protein